MEIEMIIMCNDGINGEDNSEAKYVIMAMKSNGA